MASKKNTPKKSEGKLLTEVELEMMTILWRCGSATVNEVLAALSKERKLAYTSVSTMLRILEQKGIVASEKAGRGHIYRPVLQKHEYENKSVNHLVDNVFDGAPTQLFVRLLESNKLSPDEISDLRKLLEEKANQ